jgi:hypothetical protein
MAKDKVNQSQPEAEGALAPTATEDAVQDMIEQVSEVVSEAVEQATQEEQADEPEVAGTEVDEYVCLSSIWHLGILYHEGDVVPGLNDDQIQQLTRIGVVAKRGGQ